jgi:hypothetical protein
MSGRIVITLSVENGPVIVNGRVALQRSLVGTKRIACKGCKRARDNLVHEPECVSGCHHPYHGHFRGSGGHERESKLEPEYIGEHAGLEQSAGLGDVVCRRPVHDCRCGLADGSGIDTARGDHPERGIALTKGSSRVL